MANRKVWDPKPTRKSCARLWYTVQVLDHRGNLVSTRKERVKCGQCQSCLRSKAGVSTRRTNKAMKEFR